MEELERRIKQSFFNLLERPRSPGSIHVSALPFCLRKEFFNIKFNANPQPNPAMVSGKIYHLVLEHLDFLKGCRFEEEYAYGLGNGWWITARIDAIDENRREVWEFKFTKRLSSTELDPFYFAQACTYAVMANCERYFIVKVHRDTFDVKVLEGKADVDVFDALKQRALHIIDCLENNTIPPGPERDWECKNCVYSIICSNLKTEERRMEE